MDISLTLYAPEEVTCFSVSIPLHSSRPFIPFGVPRYDRVL